MASIRDLKKDIDVVLGDIIEAVYMWEARSGNKNSKAGAVITNKVLATFDDFRSQIHQKSVANRKAHFKAIRSQLEEKAAELVEDLNALVN